MRPGWGALSFWLPGIPPTWPYLRLWRFSAGPGAPSVCNPAMTFAQRLRRSIRAPGLERDHLASAGIEETPMGSQAASAHRPGTTWLILLGLVVVLVGSVAWATFAWQSRPVTSQVTEPPAPSAIARYPRLPIDESGTLLVHEHFFVPHIKDPTSLEDIRDAYGGAGPRCIEFIKQQLAPAVPADKRMPRLINLARAYFWVGEFRSAAEALAQARHLADAEPSQFEQIRPTVLFLQGVAALRRGETENCVDCQCRTSCILPIQPEAVHQKREGSREAIGL